MTICPHGVPHSYACDICDSEPAKRPRKPLPTYWEGNYSGFVEQKGELIRLLNEIAEASDIRGTDAGHSGIWHRARKALKILKPL